MTTNAAHLYPSGLANNFLEDGHSVTQTLNLVGPVLAQALTPPDHLYDNTYSHTGSPSADSLVQKMQEIDLAHPLGSLSSALEELGPIWLDHAVRYDSPRYLAHLNCPITEPSFAAAVVSAGVNTAVETWDQARGAAIIEDRLVRWLAEAADMNPSAASGVFTSGGTQSNLQALYTAREKALKKGSDMGKLVVICSAEAHYSISRSCHILGLGQECIRKVPTADSGACDPEAFIDTLDQVLRDPSITPMCIALTAGTTDLGAIDPLKQCIDIARTHGIHVHVDCAYGGALLVSPTRRHLLYGLEHADSFSVDFHKSFFQPVACSALIYRDSRDIDHVTWHAEYLNHAADERLNLADRSLQTTRRFDALKLWLTLRTSGAEAIGRDFDTCCDLAICAYHLARSTQQIEVLTSPNLSTLLLRYSPELTTSSTTSGQPETGINLDILNNSIRRHLFDSDLAIIGSTQRRGATWLKLTLLNPALTRSNLQEALTLIKSAGDQLLASTSR